ncbi:hypothetical protein [Anderseniella sp. Alg231-50]|uniref:hypothetical protein n=1 Tax=Anderseniella sp. Alg231-50 TaxID=1922226 RepID=UPI000D554DF7
MDFNELMPFIVFWIPWLMAVNELRNHFRNGFMNEYLRRSSEDDEPATRTTTLARHPISYRLLLLLYASTAIAVPVVTAFVLYNRQAG